MRAIEGRAWSPTGKKSEYIDRRLIGLLYRILPITQKIPSNSEGIFYVSESLMAAPLRIELRSTALETATLTAVLRGYHETLRLRD